jgi:antitoxin component of RelBE/YafQ-DinJ toxin-antitoxin module
MVITMTNTTTIAVNRDFKTSASKKLQAKGVPLSVAVNMFLKKVANDEISIDFMNNNNFSSEEIEVSNKDIATLMDEVGSNYCNI